VTTRRSGDVLVEVTFDPRARLHRSSPPGAYRARVSVDDETIDRMLIGAPASLAERATDDDVIDEIAVTALSYTLGDRPDLPVARDEKGLPKVEVAK